MFINPTPPPHPIHLSLSLGELLTLTPTQPTTLHLQSGVLWVTQTGDHHDHFLKAGQSMQLSPGRLTVVQAERASVQACLLRPATHSAKLQPCPNAHQFLLTSQKLSGQASCVGD
ncbi:MAG: DUF2917 domain-containing protein [Rhizobacter sp.]